MRFDVYAKAAKEDLSGADKNNLGDAIAEILVASDTAGEPIAPSTKRTKRTALGKRLVTAAREVAAHLRGEIQLTEYQVRVPDAVDVAALRRRLNLSQAAFARAYRLEVAAVRAWEQHRRKPDRTARILLAVIAREPESVVRALAE